MLPRVGVQVRLLFVITILVGLGQSSSHHAAAAVQHRSAGFRAALERRSPSKADAPLGRQQVENSDNWSGYKVLSTASPSSPQAPTSVQGSWTVPQVSFSAGGTNPAEYSSIWVGIGGAEGVTGPFSSSLIQIGTEQDADNSGNTQYYAWYELLPADMVRLPNPIQPGDAISASLACVEFCGAFGAQRWLIALTDRTAGWTFSQSVGYGSSQGSAEWIVEAPTDTTTNEILPLANFNHTGFDTVSLNGGNPLLGFANNAIRMTDKSGQTSNPSTPSAAGAFSVCWNGGAAFAACPLDTAPPEASAVVAAVLPTSRSVLNNHPATLFATIVNPGSQPATNCMIQLVPDLATAGAAFQYQQTDPMNNQLIGVPNQPATIPPGGAQSFIMTMASQNQFYAYQIYFDFSCDGWLPAAPILGVNTFTLAVTGVPTPDVIALVATEKNDGTLHIPGVGNASAFAMATDNVGIDGVLTLAPNTGNASLPLDVTICQTDPNSVCMAPPAPNVTLTIAAGAQPTFSVFATATGPIPFSPAASRIFLQFTDADGMVRGSSSVAVATQ
ncbi:MAG TPA: G1 family glutamic endopeptidase [Aliidongia sp.]|nr:G1 family glutamic endopeptidase [Aliidongia sp.]